MKKIQTYPYKGGNEKESEWPPRKEIGEIKGFLGYWHKEQQKFVEGYRPQPEKLGDAPVFLSDSMPPQFHTGIGKMVDSRSEWKNIDKENGWITLGKDEQIKPKAKKSLKERQAEMAERTARAINDVKYGNAPLSERTREMCRRRDEQISSALGMDAVNCLGIKKDGKKRNRK